MNIDHNQSTPLGRKLNGESRWTGVSQMKPSRRTAVLSFMLLAAASAVPAQVAADVYMPKPPCNK